MPPGSDIPGYSLPTQFVPGSAKVGSELTQPKDPKRFFERIPPNTHPDRFGIGPGGSVRFGSGRDRQENPLTPLTPPGSEVPSGSPPVPLKDPNIVKPTYNFEIRQRESAKKKKREKKRLKRAGDRSSEDQPRPSEE